MASPKNNNLNHLITETVFVFGVVFFSGIISFSNALQNETRLTSLPSAYVYPNPVKDGHLPILVVEPGLSEKIIAEIYDAAGGLVYRSRVDGNSNNTLGGKPIFEHVLQTPSLRPGVYGAVVTGYINEEPQANKKFQFTVLK